MKKPNFHVDDIDTTLGGLTAKEKATQATTRNVKSASPKEVRGNQPQNKAEKITLEAHCATVKAQLEVDGTGSEVKKRLELLIKILSQTPEAYRGFLMALPGLEPEDFELYSLELFKALELNKETVWKVQSAIAYDIYERSEIFKSKGGCGSKGRGLGIRFEEECIKLGLSSATMQDYRRIYTIFVVEPTLEELDANNRRERQMDILESLRLKRFFYFRACSAPDPYKAIKMAERRLNKNWGEYTEKQFIQDIKRQKENLGRNSGSKIAQSGGGETNGSIAEETVSEQKEFTCSVKNSSYNYLKKQSVNWRMPVGMVLDHLVESCRKFTDPKEVVLG